MDFVSSFFTKLITSITFALDGIRTTFYRSSPWPKGLGSLQVLPYEIREHISMIALEEYFDELNRRREHLSEGESPSYEYGHLSRSELKYNFEERSCFCVRNNELQFDVGLDLPFNRERPQSMRETPFGNVFDLASYCGMPQSVGRTPLHLRDASLSVEFVFDRIFLTRSTFVFVCPATMKKFLDQLRPYQQKQLRFLRLCMFESPDCPIRWRDRLMAVCGSLPPQISSVEMVLPIEFDGMFSLWVGTKDDDRSKGKSAFEYTAEGLQEFCKEVSRAVPQAKIFLSGLEGDVRGKYDVSDAMLHQAEPLRDLLIKWFCARWLAQWSVG